MKLREMEREWVCVWGAGAHVSSCVCRLTHTRHVFLCLCFFLIFILTDGMFCLVAAQNTNSFVPLSFVSVHVSFVSVHVFVYIYLYIYVYIHIYIYMCVHANKTNPAEIERVGMFCFRVGMLKRHLSMPPPLPLSLCLYMCLYANQD